VIEIDPENSAAWSNRGSLLAALGNATVAATASVRRAK
jgi:hypothetical protein